VLLDVGEEGTGVGTRVMNTRRSQDIDAEPLKLLAPNRQPWSAWIKHDCALGDVWSRLVEMERKRQPVWSGSKDADGRGGGVGRRSHGVSV